MADEHMGGKSAVQYGVGALTVRDGAIVRPALMADFGYGSDRFRHLQTRQAMQHARLAGRDSIQPTG